ncbi:DUF2690 domain-containing protein [Streptomyces sp. MBT56]|uniref:DUF2690 domain-containing protein n=1 Tax=unclassified Streptomyces TaxID=2593676 RepID=UPI00190A4ACF|nr:MULTISPECIES: DUF2690 domain-containing protein [unclassified Streptomyces]MBK3559762.1 DUF2690 domain-containing protein [Streptomyces sp. MBT56]MBK3601296.1 DUF2690 domain-containing protein [Streptomyces sp. MBT54]MBK3615257.1 DUF2690 domain-containing protein [Streptomyces sp. MBT98]
MRIKRAIAGLAVASAMVATTMVVTPEVASATTGGCYGASCNGKNPSGTCDDGKTVAAQAVPWGMLELRWSPSCAANWGRYTPYDRSASSLAAMKKGIYARVTAWNPGGPSYGTAYHAPGVYGSSWSQMVDGRTTACTGVEVVITNPNGDYDSQGWSWGPCY